ncbi:Protein CBR-KBP-5 [Caenorhabditis briggsae]|uniref:Uncharacterized protein n=2 Tax=Caenorhabditis briggsae TaxID=6238 RepID=A0AAE9DXP0_CAEBR|nr:Protein CBR-KBP-5 [Caenorhabditis briggsae]ULU13082.1 hypothetical protein L3Y34_015935 [Caenorhabditis briggsae]CAP31728.1 Protein CBR-KBP-5 [Caenorhabditis briggsae]
MNPERNQDILELYSQEIFVKAIKDGEQFLENNLPIDGDQKDRLLTKVLEGEKKFEDNRKKMEGLKKEQAELKAKLVDSDLEMLEKLRAERDELQRKHQADNNETITSQKSIDEILRMKQETAKMREIIQELETETKQQLC